MFESNVGGTTETGDVTAVATLTDDQVAAVVSQDKGETNVQVNNTDHVLFSL